MTMPASPSDLAELRRRLDEIDDRMHDLLIERAEIVSLVAATKRTGDQPAFQPAREAEIIRRLVGRHRGSFPLFQDEVQAAVGADRHAVALPFTR